jgi:hypothetical protein
MTDLTSVAREAAEEVALTIGEDRAREQGFTFSCTGGCAEMHAHSQGVILGFTECASRIPSEEELAEAIAAGYDSVYAHRLPVNEHDLRAARAVLALIGEKISG